LQEQINRKKVISDSAVQDYSQFWLQYRPAEVGVAGLHQSVIRHVCCLGGAALIRNAEAELIEGASRQMFHMLSVPMCFLEMTLLHIVDAT
jgi:hypothetical protein